MTKIISSIVVLAGLLGLFFLSKIAFGVAVGILVGLICLGIWVKGGGQKAEYSIPKSTEGPPFRTYEAVVPESPLKLLHFISQPEEINVSSSLIMGDKELICVTAQATKFAAQRLADEIEKTGRELTYIFLDHAHVDHSQGATELLERFPKAKCVAAPRVAELQQRRIPNDDDFARGRYGENAAIPSRLFEPLEGDKIMLEGREIQLWHDQYGDVGIGEPDEPHTVIYIPDLKALLPTDCCYWGGHMMMGGSTSESRAKWMEQIREWMQMDLEVVIPGHILRDWSTTLTPQATLEYSLQYIADYDAVIAESSSSAEVIEKMLEKYPEQGHISALHLGTFLNFKETHRLLFNKRLEKVMSCLPKRLVQSLDAMILEKRTRGARA